MGEVLSLEKYSSSLLQKVGPELRQQGALSRKELVSCFATNRRDGMDVLWLKENAEFLNILHSAGRAKEGLSEVLSDYEDFYEGSLRHFEFFKPYYRFTLSICLDLEDLGIGDGVLGERLVQRVNQSSIFRHELSDLQRAETRRLLARRGCEPANLDGLDDRVRAFMEFPAAFAVPNRRTAYELTHVVFYLSNYGRQDPKLSRVAVQSVEYVGIMAFLDQDADLLSEACVALHYCGQTVPDAWRAWLIEQRAAIQMSTQPLENSEADDYHKFFVMEWAISEVVRKPAFESCCKRVRRFTYSGGESVLRGMTMALYELGSGDRRNPTKAIREMKSRLNERERMILDYVSKTIECFDQFLCDFVARGYSSGSRCALRWGG